MTTGEVFDDFKSAFDRVEAMRERYNNLKLKPIRIVYDM
jgi:hypothetical protein